MRFSREDYQEVYKILSHMNKIEVMKIPEEVLLEIKEKRNKNYTTKIDFNDLFNMNNISENAQILLAWLDYTYVMDELKKEELKREAYKENKNEFKKLSEENDDIKLNDEILVIENKSFIKRVLRILKISRR